MKCVDDFCLWFGKYEFVLIMIGGMGVDILIVDLVLEVVWLGGVGYILDVMIKIVFDWCYDIKFVKEKLVIYKYNVYNEDKFDVKFDFGKLVEVMCLYV